MNKWQDPSLSLGERCVAFSENEMHNGVKEDKQGSYTSPRIREYFSICTRIINGKETHINFVQGNWCSAAASFALHESLLPGEVKPHGYRLGVVEVVADLQHNGLYHLASSVKSGAYSIKIGDSVIFDRSRPNEPATQWLRHIARVYSIDGNGGFQSISGNSGGCWKINNHTLSQANLLGFGEYPALNMVVIPNNDPLPANELLESANGLNLAPLEDTGSFIDDLKGIID